MSTSLTNSVQPHVPQQDDDALNLAQLLDALLQHLWLMLVVFFIVLLIGSAWAVLAPPVYRADALIQIENSKAGMGGLSPLADALEVGRSPVAGEIEIIRSREVVLRAIETTQADLRVSINDRLPLIGDWLARRHETQSAALAPAMFGLDSYAWGGEKLVISSFLIPDGLRGKALSVRATESGFDLLDGAGGVLGSGYIGQRVDFNWLGEAASIVVGELQARPGITFSVTRLPVISVYRSLVKGLSIQEVARLADVIQLSFQHTDRIFAKEVVNAVASAYLRQNVERSGAEAAQSLAFLEQQLPVLKKQVDASEQALNAYRTNSRTLSVDKSADSLLSRAVALESSRLQLELQREQLLQRYQPVHPEVRAMDDQLNTVTAELKKLNDEVGRLPAAQKDLLPLERDALVNNELYTSLLNSAQTLRLAKAGSIGSVRIVDFAVIDNLPVAPQRGTIAGIAAIIGLMLGIGAVAAVRIFRPTVNGIDEVERATGLSTFATVPESVVQDAFNLKPGVHQRHQGTRRLLAISNPDDPAVESLRSLRTALAFAQLGATDKNIVVTGATAGLGKSFISANLSAVLALGGKRVLLIETDMRRPQLGRYFGFEKTQAGLSDILSGITSFDRAVLHDAVVGLDILPSGQIPPNPGELLTTAGFAELLESIQGRYDHVILDSAPVLPVADTLAVIRHVSTAFLVVRAEQSTLGEVRDAIKRIQGAGGSISGLVYNGVKRNRIGYGTAYKYYYSYGTEK